VTEFAYRVHICHGPNCTPRGGARALIEALEAEMRRLGIEDRVEILATSCRNRCELGPSVNVYPGPVCYGHLTPAAITRIAREHLLSDLVVTEYQVADKPRPVIDFSKLDKIF